MTPPDAEKARACAGMHGGRVRAQAALLAWRRMPRGCPEARGGFGCNLGGRATVFFTDVRKDSQLYVDPGNTKERGEEVVTYHVWHSEVCVGGVWHSHGEVTHPCLPFWKPFPETLWSNIGGVT